MKIFITPYRTTITDKDLEFSQGDYNVELVLALNVENSEITDVSDYEPSLEEVQRVISQFVGKIEQTPPIFSAIKINGERAYYHPHIYRALRWFYFDR